MKKILRKISECKSILVINVMALICLSACINVYGNYTKPEELDPESREFLHEIAERTWKYLVFSTGEFGIPADHVILREDQKLHIADYTSVTNIGLFLMALPAAVDFGFLSPAEGDKWLKKLVAFIKAMPKSEGGLYYNYFKIKERKPDKQLYVSSVDNAWIAAGLKVVSKTGNTELQRLALKLYNDMDFSRSLSISSY